MKKTLKKNRNNRNVKGGSAILVKHTQKTLSDAKKICSENIFKGNDLILNLSSF